MKKYYNYVLKLCNFYYSNHRFDLGLGHLSLTCPTGLAAAVSIVLCIVFIVVVVVIVPD